jgi:uncharacterized repeat protein (TIGR01451 family)
MPGVTPLAEIPKQPALPPAFRLVAHPHPTPPGPAPAAAVTGVPTLPDALAGPAVPTPMLTLEKHGPAVAPPGQPVAYEIIVRNVGPVPAAQVHVEDELPLGARVVGAVPPPVPQGQRLTWTVPLLPPGQEARFRVEALPSAGGDLAGAATLTVGVRAEMRTRVPPAAGLEVAVEGPETAAVSQTVPFKIHIISHDAQPLHKLVLLVRLPEGLQHPAGKEIEADLGDLEPGKSRNIDLQVNAAAAGRHAIEAVVNGATGTQAHGQAVLTVTPKAPPPRKPESNLLLHMSGPKQVVQGQPAEYQIVVVNRGLSELTNVVVYDRLPEELNYLTGGRDGTYDKAKRVVQWRLGTLPPHQERMVILRVQARASGEPRPELWAEDEQGDLARLVPTPMGDQAPRGPAGAAPQPAAADRGRGE